MQIDRGTTPTITISCDFDTSLITDVDVGIRQGTKLITKNLSDCTVETGKLITALTANESLKLEPGTARIQAVITIDNKITASNSVDVRIYDTTLSVGVMADDG